MESVHWSSLSDGFCVQNKVLINRRKMESFLLSATVLCPFWLCGAGWVHGGVLGGLGTTRFQVLEGNHQHENLHQAAVTASIYLRKGAFNVYGSLG